MDWASGYKVSAHFRESLSLSLPVAPTARELSVVVAAVAAAQSRSMAGPLSAEEVAAYDRDGFVIVRNFFPAEVVESVRQGLTEVMEDQIDRINAETPGALPDKAEGSPFETRYATSIRAANVSLCSYCCDFSETCTPSWPTGDVSRVPCADSPPSPRPSCPASHPDASHLWCKCSRNTVCWSQAVFWRIGAIDCGCHSRDAGPADSWTCSRLW